jgi:hypothetical protein
MAEFSDDEMSLSPSPEEEVPQTPTKTPSSKSKPEQSREARTQVSKSCWHTFFESRYEKLSKTQGMLLAL